MFLFEVLKQWVFVGKLQMVLWFCFFGLECEYFVIMKVFKFYEVELNMGIVIYWYFDG